MELSSITRQSLSDIHSGIDSAFDLSAAAFNIVNLAVLDNLLQLFQGVVGDRLVPTPATAFAFEEIFSNRRPLFHD